MFLPVQAYFAGMDCPLMNASLVSSRDIVASVADDADVAVGSGTAVAWMVSVTEDEHDANKMDVNAR
jgi:hypothetical protein